jgi:aminopeptidase-like protein
MEIPSGTKFSTWTIPDEWVVRDAWVKYEGKKIIDYRKNGLSVVIGSIPVNKKVILEELKKHLHINKDATPYVFKYYDKDWGFCMKDTKLKEGQYEVFIDSEYRPGTMKIGVHTKKGKIDKEILLLAHLDHPLQANDNLSGVCCMLDVIRKIKTDYTVKVIFCPETIGSIAYAHLADLSKVELAISVDICGNDAPITQMKTFKSYLDSKLTKLDSCAHCAFQSAKKMYRKAPFRGTIGSDETVFADPDFKIPAILFTTHPYDEYHTDKDRPENISYEKIIETADLVRKTIEIFEKDYVPIKNWKGPVMRSRYGIQSPSQQVNLNYDYLFYSVDGKRSIAELSAHFEMDFDETYKIFEKMADEGFICRSSDSCKKPLKKTRKQK